MPIIDLRGDDGPDLGSQLLNFFIQKQQLEQERERIKLAGAEQKLRVEEAAFKRGEMQNALGTLLQGVQSGDQFATEFVGGNIALGAALRDRALSAQELADPAVLGAVRNIEDARTNFNERVTGAFRQRLAQATPQEAASLAASAPAPALAQADVRESLTRLQDEARDIDLRQRIVGRLPEGPQREAASLMLEWEDATDAERTAMFPELFAGGVDRLAVDSAIRLSILSGLPFGEARQPFNVPQLPGLPDDFRFPINLGGAATARQQVIGMHASSLAFHGPIIEEIEREEGGISLPAQIHRELMVSSAMSGGLFGVAAAVGDVVANWFTGLTGRQQELVAAQFNWANSYRYLASGQQTSDREFGIILRTTMANVGDTQETIAQKRTFRQTLEESALRVSRGESSGVESVRELQVAAQNLTSLPAEDRIALAGMLSQIGQDAARFQTQANPAPLVPNALTGDPAADLAAIDTLIRGLTF